MKIAIFSDNFYPELSGISDSVISLAKELAHRGDSVTFYVPQYSRKNFETAHKPYEELQLGDNISFVRLHSISVPTPTGQGRFVDPIQHVIGQMRRWRPDIIHTQLFFGAGWLALRAAKKLKVPLVGTNHTAITEFARYAPPGFGWIGGLLIRYAVWYYNKCDFVTAPSQSVFDEMQKFGFSRPHMVMSNPIETNSFSIPSDSQRTELKSKFGLTGPTLVYAGRLAAEKNIDVVIKALPLIIKSIPNIQFAIAGHGVDQNNLQNLAKQLGVESHVKFTGLLDKSALADLYRASEIFTITSTSETQNMTMMQAMATGLPIIGVRARALPEYINHDNGYIVEPGDSAALAEKAILLLKDPQLWQTTGQNGFNFVQTVNPEHIAQKWREIYQNTIRAYNTKHSQD